MISFKQFLNEQIQTREELFNIGKKLLNFKDSEEDMKLLDTFISALTIGGRSPAGLKKEYEKLKYFKQWIETWKKQGWIPQPVGASLSYWDEDYINLILDNFAFSNRKKVKDNIVIDNNTYLNESSLSESKFLNLTKIISELLNRLDGEYKKALKGGIKIIFKPSTEMKSKAVYKSDKDELWIRNSPDTLKLFDKELYGWVPYIIVHELGHRYDKFEGVPKWFNRSFITSKYSSQAGFGDEEVFAECFAISFFGDSVSPEYPKWRDKIELFKSKFLGK